MNYKKNYYFLSVSLIIIIFICFIVIWIIDSSSKMQKISNILSNTIAGLISGLIIMILGNLKNNQIQNYEKKIQEYNKLKEEGNDIKDSINKFNNKDKKDLSELYIIVLNIKSFYRCIQEMIIYDKKNNEELHLEEKCKNVSNFIEKIKNDIDCREDNIFLSKEEYCSIYKKELISYIYQISSLIIYLYDINRELKKQNKVLKKYIL